MLEEEEVTLVFIEAVDTGLELEGFEGVFETVAGEVETLGFL
jgi:hypothetical protein